MKYLNDTHPINYIIPIINHAQPSDSQKISMRTSSTPTQKGLPNYNYPYPVKLSTGSDPNNAHLRTNLNKWLFLSPDPVLFLIYFQVLLDMVRLETFFLGRQWWMWRRNKGNVPMQIQIELEQVTQKQNQIKLRNFPFFRMEPEDSWWFFLCVFFFCLDPYRFVRWHWPRDCRLWDGTRKNNGCEYSTSLQWEMVHELWKGRKNKRQKQIIALSVQTEGKIQFGLFLHHNRIGFDRSGVRWPVISAMVS